MTRDDATNVKPVDSWVYMCSSLSSSATTVIANNVDVTTCSGGCSVSAPQALSVNGFANGEKSDFGIAEMMLWNRALSTSELYAAQTYLNAKYGFEIGSDIAAISTTTNISTDTK